MCVRILIKCSVNYVLNDYFREAIKEEGIKEPLI